MSAKKKQRSLAKRHLINRLSYDDHELPHNCDVCVIGAGASGLVSAITAAENGAKTVLIEKNSQVGTSILATGNGRCNFANTCLQPKRYNNPAFVNAVCKESFLDDILSFFKDCGLRWCTIEDRLYPLSLQAASVLSVLIRRAQRAGVIIRTSRLTEGLTYKKGNFCICLSSQKTHIQEKQSHDRKSSDAYNKALETLYAKKLILATGASSIELFARFLELKTAPVEPVLVPLSCKKSPLLALDGRRIHARATLKRGGKKITSERGEVLFRNYGLSGIVIFNLSRRAEPKDIIELDCLPDYSENEIQQIIDPTNSGDLGCAFLDGICDPAFAFILKKIVQEQAILTHCNTPQKNTPLYTSSPYKKDAVKTLIGLLKALPFSVIEKTRTDQAQAQRGGLLSCGFNEKTLESKEIPGLFSCGEALDVDGDCGGFNLAWAWKSALIAGKSAALSLKSCISF